MNRVLDGTPAFERWTKRRNMQVTKIVHDDHAGAASGINWHQANNDALNHLRQMLWHHGTRCTWTQHQGAWLAVDMYHMPTLTGAVNRQVVGKWLPRKVWSWIGGSCLLGGLLLTASALRKLIGATTNRVGLTLGWRLFGLSPTLVFADMISMSFTWHGIEE